MAGREWYTFDAHTFAQAAVLAETLARATREKALVVATIYEGEIGFTVLTDAGYAALREANAHRHVAPIATVTPDGERIAHEPFRGISIGTAERPDPENTRLLLTLANIFDHRGGADLDRVICADASERLRRTARLITSWENA